MAPEATTAFVARSRPKVVELLVLGAVTIFLAYSGLSAFDTSLPVIGLFQLGRPPQGLGHSFRRGRRRQLCSDDVAGPAPAQSER
jgi:hypothetical protein